MKLTKYEETGFTYFKIYFFLQYCRFALTCDFYLHNACYFIESCCVLRSTAVTKHFHKHVQPIRPTSYTTFSA